MSNTDDTENINSKMLLYTLKFLREHEQKMDSLTIKIENAKSDLMTGLEKVKARIEKIDRNIVNLQSEFARIKEATSQQ